MTLSSTLPKPLVYEALRDSRDYGVMNQMPRATVSIPSNIADEYERGTTKGKSELWDGKAPERIVEPMGVRLEL